MMGIGRSLTIIALGVMFWSLAITPSSLLADDGQKVAINYKTGERVVVKPLDDADNPYRDQYDAWDMWAFENYSWDYSWVEGGQWIRDKVTPAGVEVIASRVDADGYMLPYVLWLEQSRAWRAGRTLQEVVSHEPMPESGMLAFMAEGEMDEALGDAYKLAMAKQRAARWPTIPDWIMDLHPMYVQALYALDDGRWVIETTVASGYIEYRLYSADGELLPNPHKPTGTDWEDILWDYYGTICDSPHFQIRPEVFENGVTYDQANVTKVPGYTILYDFDTEEISAVWDYDGALLYDVDWKRFPNVCDIKVRPVRYGERFPGYWQEIYYAQRGLPPPS